MWKNDTFNEITEMVLRQKLGLAITTLENHLLAHPGGREMEQLLQVKADYDRLCQYWRKGYPDEERETIYRQLLRRMYVLTTNTAIHDHIRNTSFLTNTYNRARKARNDWSMTAVKGNLEEFVSNVAMLSLEDDDHRKEKSLKVYAAHQQVMKDLFDYIITSRLWKDSLAEAFEEILLSPTIDTNDQQLIISAVTISAMNALGFNKLKVLSNVYLKSRDEHVRQRALVGWALCLNADMGRLYTEMGDMVARMTAEETSRQELTELQMQLFYCLNTEHDHRQIEKEILPELLKNGSYKITPHGIEEVEDNSVDDILHPDAAEKRVEHMESLMQRMSDMQRKGVDIYFGSFSKIKHYAFFHDISNWFVPYFEQHPDLADAWKNIGTGQKALRMLTRVGAFCDSDCYTLVLTFNQVLNRLPKEMLDLIDSNDGAMVPVGGTIDDSERNQPAFIRRMYLHDLYRFFRLYPMRSIFRNPFAPGSDGSDLLFFSNRLFEGTPLEKDFPQVASFLMKHKHIALAAPIVARMAIKDDADYPTNMLAGELLSNYPDSILLPYPPTHYFQRALQQQPDSRKAKTFLARSAFKEDDFSTALEAYRELFALHPDNTGYELGIAICLMRLNQNDEAQQMLFRLQYNNPANDSIERALAWSLTIAGKFEQAEKLFVRLLASDRPEKADLLNYGYCLWLSRNIETATGIFKQFVDGDEANLRQLEHDFCHTEKQLLADNGITPVEANIMLDQLAFGS